MSPAVWSWVLTAVGVSALFLAGGKAKRLGWALAVANQALWITYAVATAQYGFIAASVCYAVVFVRNWRNAR